MDRINAAVRVYSKLKDDARKHTANHPKVQNIQNYDKFLCFDTETRSDEAQALTFGSFVIMNNNAVEGIGLFYAQEEVTTSELEVLKAYCKSDPTIKLYTLQEFVEQVFYPTVYTDQVTCTAYNAPFDISRLAISFGYAKGWMRGGFTFKLSNDKRWPSIRVKHINTAESLIQFQGTRYAKFKGNFVDCQKIAVILTDSQRISLKKACAIFNKKYQKLETTEHGKITTKYVDYNIRDTLATAELFINLRNEYNKYGIKLPLTEVYSSASMGKAFLENLGIVPFMKLNPNFPPELLGKLSQAYYGGRCECRIRKTHAKVSILDFVSQYPSLFLLLGLYDFLIAERVDYLDDTENVKRFVDNITLSDLRNPNIWKLLNVIVEVEPEDDLLPLRAEYGEDTLTVGLNHVTSKKSLYWGLPSVVLSKLIISKTPKIKKAIRFVPIGRQTTLKKATILGMEIDPRKDNIFKSLVEERHRCKKVGDVKEKCIKIIVNSTSYGIYMELNREDEKSDLIVYSGDETFTETKRFEKEGRHYNPIIATLITDGAKLLLGIGDYILQKHNEVVAYADTDSLAVPPQYADEVVTFFDALNPYDNVSHLLKVEEKSIWFYGISAKRYVLYDMNDKGDFIIKDDEGNENYSLHGLGHLSNPFNKTVTHWQKEIWLDLLRLHYKKIGEVEFLNKYRNTYAISQFSVSTASLMRRFEPLNKRRTYNKKVKPFNFFMIGFGNNEAVKPIAPFCNDPQAMPYGDFINYKNGKKMNGQQHFKSLSDELWSYNNHPESKLSKSNGDTGTLQRRHISIDRTIYIGKEADKIEENLSGLGKVYYNVYKSPEDTQKIISKILSMSLKDARLAGISKGQYYNLFASAKKGRLPNLKNKTLKRLQFLD
jgi:hypothetical protein